MAASSSRYFGPGGEAVCVSIQVAAPSSFCCRRNRARPSQSWCVRRISARSCHLGIVGRLIRRILLRFPRKQGERADYSIVDGDRTFRPRRRPRSGPGTTSSSSGSILSRISSAPSPAIPSDALSGVGRTDMGPVLAQEDELGRIVQDDPADERAQVLKQVTDIVFARRPPAGRRTWTTVGRRTLTNRHRTPSRASASAPLERRAACRAQS